MLLGLRVALTGNDYSRYKKLKGQDWRQQSGVQKDAVWSGMKKITGSDRANDMNTFFSVWQLSIPPPRLLPDAPPRSWTWCCFIDVSKHINRLCRWKFVSFQNKVQAPLFFCGLFRLLLLISPFFTWNVAALTYKMTSLASKMAHWLSLNIWSFLSLNRGLCDLYVITFHIQHTVK